MGKKIMIVEDDPLIRSELKNLLVAQGYVVVAPEDFSSVVEKVREELPHLLLLDVKLPGESGFALCAQIRAFSQLPIVFVTSANTDMDELNSIMLGGDAFITKPYNTAILLAKIAQLLHRAYPTESENEHLTWQGATLDLAASRIVYDGHAAELTKNEVKILYYLFKHAGKICTRADIVEYLWDNQLYVDDNALSVNVGRIRQKLAGIGLEHFIQTKHRQGYLL